MTIPDKINKAAYEGLTASWSEKRPKYCSRWVRQVFEHALGLVADTVPTYKFREKYFGGNANETEDKWRAAGLILPANTKLYAGDLVFQTWMSDGHVGIVVKRWGFTFIAENTTRKGDEEWREGRMLTHMWLFGKIRSVGRWK